MSPFLASGGLLEFGRGRLLAVMFLWGVISSCVVARGDDSPWTLRSRASVQSRSGRAASKVEFVQVRKRPESKVNQVLDRLDTANFRSPYTDDWVRMLKEIVDLGPAAVPDLIAELDVTESNLMFRHLGFALRAIDDKRAVPALIRAVPRTLLQQRSSDMGYRASDKELLAFMQKHDLQENDREGSFSYGRPMREITGALVKLTGTTQGEAELRWVYWGGSDEQKHSQRRIFYRYAQRWEHWWEQNWRKHVADEAYAKVRLPPDDDEPTSAFPHGGDYRWRGVAGGAILESDAARDAAEVFYDLDTGRHAPLPERFRGLADDASRLDAIQDWAATEGFDLMGTEWLAPGGKERHYVIRSLGMTAWEISDFRWETFEKELAGSEPVKLGRPANGLLLHFDEKTKRLDAEKPASFLFATREGAYGLLRVGVEVKDTNVKLDGPPLRAGEDPVLDPVGFFKGRRFSCWIVEGTADSQAK